jgi:hypothetical protein
MLTLVDAAVPRRSRRRVAASQPRQYKGPTPLGGGTGSRRPLRTWDYRQSLRAQRISFDRNAAQWPDHDASPAADRPNRSRCDKELRPAWRIGDGV